MKHHHRFGRAWGRLMVGVLLAAWVAACGDEAGTPSDTGDVGGGPLPDIDYPEFGMLARFDLDAARTDAFFAFPWPSDLRRTADGHLDLESFPVEMAAGNLLRDFRDMTQARVTGFSNVSAVYFTFEDAVDPESLPVDAAAAMAEDATAYLIDIDPASPWYGRRHPLEAIYRDEPGVYWEAHTLVLQPLYGFPLRAATRYAAIVTTGVRSEVGDPVIGPPAFRGIFDGSADPELMDHYQPLLEAIEDLRIHPNTISMATVFTTSAPAQEMFRLRTWIHDALPTPEAESVSVLSDGYQYDLYEGTFPFEELQDGEPPFRRFGEGSVTLGESGEPQTRVPVHIRFALSVPPSQMPEDGWPVVLYHHGTGGDYLSFTRNATAREMARRGVAVMGIDQPLHGPRNPTDQDELDLITQLAVSNLIGSAGMLAQGVADLVQATRLLRAGVEIPASISLTGEAIRTDPERLAYMGHSQGAQTGALFLGIEPDIPTGVLSEGGGGAAISAILRKDNDIDIEQIVSLALGLDSQTEPLVVYHPVLACIAQPLFDWVDPLSYGRHIFLEPLAGRPHNLLMTIGYHDAATPPPGIEALASTAGLPIAEPVIFEVEAMQLQGIGSVALPATGNLPERDGVRPTGALIQFPGRNHYLVSRDVGAQFQVYEFLYTALLGEATLYRAEDR